MATLEVMYPGRPYLGFGSGEALNEAPLGHGWPPVSEQIERMEEALEMIRRSGRPADRFLLGRGRRGCTGGHAGLEGRAAEGVLHGGLAQPEGDVRAIRQVEELGETTVALMNNSGANPHGAIELYGREVLPKLSQSPAPA